MAAGWLYIRLRHSLNCQNPTSTLIHIQGGFYTAKKQREMRTTITKLIQVSSKSEIQIFIFDNTNLLVFNAIPSIDLGTVGKQ